MGHSTIEFVDDDQLDEILNIEPDDFINYGFEHYEYVNDDSDDYDFDEGDDKEREIEIFFESKGIDYESHFQLLNCDYDYSTLLYDLYYNKIQNFMFNYSTFERLTSDVILSKLSYIHLSLLGKYICRYIGIRTVKNNDGLFDEDSFNYIIRANTYILTRKDWVDEIIAGILDESKSEHLPSCNILKCIFKYGLCSENNIIKYKSNYNIDGYVDKHYIYNYYGYYS